MDVMALKVEALEGRQDLDHLVSLYDQFQRYVELLAAVVRGEQPPAELPHVQKKLQFELQEQEGRFLEWQDGNKVLNADVFGLVDEPTDDLRNPAIFANVVAGATAKFEHLIRQAERSLRHLHEKIALVEGEAQAQEITTLESKHELQERISKADSIAEVGLKWGTRIYRFGSWAANIASSFGSSAS